MEIDKNKTEYLCYNGPIGNGDKHNHLKLKIGVSGASDTTTCGVNALEQARFLGKEIVRQGGILITGASPGFPLWVAMGVKEEKGMSIGISPAANEQEHVDTYRFPVDYMDLIIYTGFGHAGGDLLFTRSCDAIIIGCGHLGSIHEFTIAFQDGKPVGVLDGGWDTTDTIKTIISRSNRTSENVIIESDPKILVQKILAMAAKNKRN